MEKLEQRLNQVWIGSYKLIANIARYTRSEVEGGRVKRIVKESPPPTKGCSWPGTYRTYADAIRSQQVPVEERMRPMKPNSLAKKERASPKGVLEMVSRESLGGREVLISNIEEEGVERLLAKEDRRASQWFTSLRLWNMFDVCFGRTVWWRCYGILFQVWTENFLELIARE
ncbi:hypothetical protein Ancab_025463 [Ancistrocladus abbreviatus]